MNVMIEKNRLGDVLKFEAENLYSREEVTVASGQNLQIGTVIGFITASGKAVAIDPTAKDGSSAAAGVICESVDATAGDKKSWIIARHAIVSEDGIVWPDAITATQLSSAILQLKKLGILIRKGA